MTPPDRDCATCGAKESAHKFTPTGWALGHPFKEKPGDEWCYDCEDWVVNGCGTPADCERRWSHIGGRRG